MHVKSKSDMDRQLIKSEWASFTLPDLEFEVNKQTNKHE